MPNFPDAFAIHHDGNVEQQGTAVIDTDDGEIKTIDSEIVANLFIKGFGDCTTDDAIHRSHVIARQEST